MTTGSAIPKANRIADRPMLSERIVLCAPGYVDRHTWDRLKIVRVGVWNSTAAPVWTTNTVVNGAAAGGTSH
jgi:hypothetical protein